jgi:hypothetical protein
MTSLRIGQLLLAAVLAAALPIRTGSAEVPESLSLSYDMWEGGLHALSLETRMNRGKSAYSVKFSVRTRGLAWLVHPFSLKAQTDGVADEHGLRPLHYRSTSEKRGKTRRQDITYLDDGSLDVRREPKKNGKRKSRVPEDLTLGTLDPASALLSIIEAFARVGRCEGSIPVYDGKHRYDLLVTQGGSRNLRSKGYGMYSGPATVCRIAVEQLAGFKTKKQHRKGRFPSAIDVWLAPLAGGTLAVPVRLEGKTDRGKMILHLVEARHREPVERAAR